LHLGGGARLGHLPTCRRHIQTVECREVETLAKHKHVRDNVAAPAGDAERQIVATAARIGVRSGYAIEVARELERAARVAQLRAASFCQRPASTFFNCPDRCKESLTVRQQIAQWEGEF